MKRYVLSGRPAGLPTDATDPDAEARRRNRERIARSQSKGRGKVSRDPRIAVSGREKRETHRSRLEAEELRTYHKTEWPSGKGGAAKRRKLAERQLLRDVTIEHGPGFQRPRPGEPNRKAASPFTREA